MLVAGANVGIRAVSIVSSIILARLLDPTDFGLMALALILLTTSSQFSGLGMHKALIQTPLHPDRASGHAFLVTLAGGTVLTGVVVVFAGPFAILLGNGRVAELLVWLAPVILMQSLSLVPEALLQKELRFGRATAATFVPEIVYLGVAVGLATAGFGLWSLAYASLIRAFVRMASLMLLCPGWAWVFPRPYEPEVTAALIGYGLKNTASGLVSFFNSILDNLMVGRLLGVRELGFYSRAYDYTRHTVDGFNNVVGSVLFPSYAKIQHDRERLAAAYARTLKIVTLFTVPAALGMFALAPDLVAGLLGEKWLPMVWAFRILSVMCLVRSLAASTSPVFLAIGRPSLDLKAGLVVLVLTLACVPALAGFGIEGVAGAVLAANLGGFLFNLRQLKELFPGLVSRLPRTAAPVMLAGVALAGGVEGARALLAGSFPGGPGILSLTVLGAWGCVCFLGVLMAADRSVISEVTSLLSSGVKPGGKEPPPVREVSGTKPCA